MQTGVVDNVCPTTINTTTTKTVTGWAAGGGVEYGIDTHWSVKAEYLLLGVQRNIQTCAQVGGFPRGDHRLHHHAHAWDPNDHSWTELPLPLKTERSNRVIAASTAQAPDGSGACCFLGYRRYRRRGPFLKQGSRAKVRNPAPQPATRNPHNEH